MKIITVIIPCYNSSKYMKKCIESVLIDLEQIEIIIVNDGSKKDNTGDIADEYQNKFPNTIKVIHKENGGHGSAVNIGIQNATGKYIKVVDSDDWLDQPSFKQIISFLASNDVDMLVTNFIYDKEGSDKKRVMNYRNSFPVEESFQWEQIKKFKIDQFIMMHSIIYKTSILRECKLQLPEHTFYVDNIFVYFPLPFVKTIHYLDVNLYHYYIGREDQSVNESIMIMRLDQQIKVNKLLFDQYNLDEMEDKMLKAYMYHHLSLVSTISTTLMIKEGSPEKLALKSELWDYMKKENKKRYRKIRYCTIEGNVAHLPSKLGRNIVLKIYIIMQKRMGFN